MIIDLILDRADGFHYDARDFYFNVMQYGGVHADEITRAMDYGKEFDVQLALSKYIIHNHYNLDIIDFIQSKKWLQNDLVKF